MVAGVDRVVTIHPTALVHPNLTQVLKIPALGEPDATLAVTGIIAKSGRLFAMGDPSVVINEMLRYPGNRAFANGLAKYLVENDAGVSRGGKLYVVANDFSQKGPLRRAAAGRARRTVHLLSEDALGASPRTVPRMAHRARSPWRSPCWPAADICALGGQLQLAAVPALAAALRCRASPRRAGGTCRPRGRLGSAEHGPSAAQSRASGRAERRALLCHQLGLVRLSSPEQILLELSRNQPSSARHRIAEVSRTFSGSLPPRRPPCSRVNA